MQIRYLEAMQAMAKSANSKVIFLPGASQNMGPSMQAALKDNDEARQEGESSFREFGGQDDGFQKALNAHVVENI